MKAVVARLGFGVSRPDTELISAIVVIGALRLDTSVLISALSLIFVCKMLFRGPVSNFAAALAAIMLFALINM